MSQSDDIREIRRMLATIETKVGDTAKNVSDLRSDFNKFRTEMNDFRSDTKESLSNLEGTSRAILEYVKTRP